MLPSEGSRSFGHIHILSYNLWVQFSEECYDLKMRNSFWGWASKRSCAISWIRKRFKDKNRVHLHGQDFIATVSASMDKSRHMNIASFQDCFKGYCARILEEIKAFGIPSENYTLLFCHLWVVLIFASELNWNLEKEHKHMACWSKRFGITSHLLPIK